MAQRQEIAAVHAAAVVQGVALVTFPAVSAILTSSAHYGLSTTEYGAMFVPQAILAIAASLLGARFTRSLGAKGVLLAGLAADLVSMAMLFGSQFTTGNHALAEVFLLTATGFLGCGFGFVVPALNTFTAAFQPTRVNAAILTLNALLGLGTALAPIFSAIFVGLGIWWGLPLLMVIATLALLLFAARLPLAETAAPAPAAGAGIIPARFWIYAAFALVYGVCETINGNWAGVYLSGSLGASTSLAALGLTVFWVSVTAGRIVFAKAEKWASWIYRGLPVLLALVFLATAVVPKGQTLLALACFGAAGLGCSALLPLVISFGQKELTAMGAGVAGGLIGFYQMGYGIAAFGVGPLGTRLHLSLGSIYGWTAAVAVGLEILAVVIVASLGGL